MNTSICVHVISIHMVAFFNRAATRIHPTSTKPGDRRGWDCHLWVWTEHRQHHCQVVPWGSWDQRQPPLQHCAGGHSTSPYHHRRHLARCRGHHCQGGGQIHHCHPHSAWWDTAVIVACCELFDVLPLKCMSSVPLCMLHDCIHFFLFWCEEGQREWGLFICFLIVFYRGGECMLQ